MARFTRIALALAASLALTAGSTACSAPVDDEAVEADGASALSNANLNATWIYNGPLPKLEPLLGADAVELTVSMSAHTARITGLLPAGFDATKIPFYAMRENVGDRIKVTVMYPVASGAPGKPHPNNDYPLMFIDPHHTTQGHFGGFPFIGYTGLIGLHGPITEDGPQWILNRGQVSGGCNRMQGEHVVEIAHILGYDMSQPRKTTADKDRSQWPKLAVSVHVHPVPDGVDGTAFDVDYPVTAGTNVVLPKVDGTKIRKIAKLPTWSADDFPASVCPVKKGAETPLPADYCARTVGANRMDLFAPFALVTTATPVIPFRGAVKH